MSAQIEVGLARLVQPSKRQLQARMAEIRAHLRYLQQDLDAGDMETAMVTAMETAALAAALQEQVFDRRLRLRPAANPYRSEG